MTGGGTRSTRRSALCSAKGVSIDEDQPPGSEASDFTPPPTLTPLPADNPDKYLYRILQSPNPSLFWVV